MSYERTESTLPKLEEQIICEVREYFDVADMDDEEVVEYFWDELWSTGREQLSDDALDRMTEEYKNLTDEQEDAFISQFRYL